MSGQLRTLKNRIRSIESTRKITRAMEMVSAAKLKRFQTLLTQTVPYTATITAMIDRLLATGSAFHHPLLTARPEKEAALLVITSDSGLCGSYNNDIIQEARRFLKTKERPPVLVGFGKNGVSALARLGYKWAQTFTDTKGPDLEHTVKKIELYLEAIFREKKVDAVYITRSKFVTKSFSKPVTEKVLPLALTPSPLPKGDGKPVSPLPLEEGQGEGGLGIPYILEPDGQHLFTRIVPLAFEAKIREMFLESFVTEQSSRMNAMHMATENAAELIDSLVLLRNKIRQASITTELIEIVSGSKALKN